MPAASVTLAAIVAVYWVLPARLAVGVNVAVFPLTFTVPMTRDPPAVGRKVNVAVVIVALFIDSEKVAEIEEFSVTPVALLAGEVLDTVGGVVSGAGPVVNCQL